MGSIKRRYSKEEFAQRGDAVYENTLCPQLTTDDEGRFAAIDIEGETYEIDEDELKGCAVAFPTPKSGWSELAPAVFIASAAGNDGASHDFGCRSKR
jgi:hypothetical protein